MSDKQPRRRDGKIDRKPFRPAGQPSPAAEGPSEMPDPIQEHPATEQALRERYAVPLTGAAPTSDVDNHLLKAQQSIDSATDDLKSDRFSNAAKSGYDAGRHAVEALMAYRGIRVDKNDQQLGQHKHKAGAEYLRLELQHSPHLSTTAAEDIAQKYDQFRRIRHDTAYEPTLTDEKTARAMYSNGKKVLKQVRFLTGREVPDQ